MNFKAKVVVLACFLWLCFVTALPNKKEYWTYDKWRKSLPVQKTGSKRSPSSQHQKFKEINIDTSKLYHALVNAFSDKGNNDKPMVAERRGNVPAIISKANQPLLPQQQRQYVNAPVSAKASSPTMAAYDPFWSNQAWAKDTKVTAPANKVVPPVASMNTFSPPALPPPPPPQPPRPSPPPSPPPPSPPPPPPPAPPPRPPPPPPPRPAPPPAAVKPLKVAAPQRIASAQRAATPHIVAPPHHAPAPQRVTVPASPPPAPTNFKSVYPPAPPPASYIDVPQLPASPASSGIDVQSFDAEVVPDGRGGMKIVDVAKKEEKTARALANDKRPSVETVINNPRNTPDKSVPVTEQKIKTPTAASKRVYSLGDHVFSDVGCYLDKWIRAIPTLEGNHPLLMDSDYKSRSDPLQKCAEASLDKGFKLFALQNGGQCFAGTGGENRYNVYGTSPNCRDDGLGGGWASEVYMFNGEPKSVQPPKRVVATNKDDMPDISFDKSDEEDYDKTLLQEEQDLSESDDKPLKWRKKNSPSTEFKGVLGKIINKVKENKDKKAEKDARTVDEGESLKAVKELFKGVKEKNEEINKHNQKLVVKDDSKNSVIKEETPISNASVLTPKVENKTSVLKEEKKAGNAEESLKNISVKDDFTKTYPLGSAVAKGQKPPCICPDKICTSKLDLAFVIDASAGSEQGGKDKMAETMEFGRRVASAFKVAPEESHVGLVTYATDAQIMMNFHRFSDPEALTEARDAVRVKPHTGKYTGQALTLAKEGLFDTGHRSDALDVLVLMTDGPSSDDITEPARKLRDMGVKIITVGIGPQIDKAQLNDIASDPDEEHVFTSDYDNLASIIRRTQKASCVGGNLKDPIQSCKCESNTEPDSETAAFFNVYQASVETPTYTNEIRYDTIPKPDEENIKKYRKDMIKYSSPKDFIKTGSPRDLPLDNPHPKDRDSSPLIELTHQTGHSAADSVEVSTPPQETAELQSNPEDNVTPSRLSNLQSYRLKDSPKQKTGEDEVTKTKSEDSASSLYNSVLNSAQEDYSPIDIKAARLKENEKLVSEYVESHKPNLKQMSEDNEKKVHVEERSNENSENSAEEKSSQKSSELLDDHFPVNTEGKILLTEEEQLLSNHKPKEQAGGSHQLPLETMQKQVEPAQYSSHQNANDYEEHANHETDRTKEGSPDGSTSMNQDKDYNKEASEKSMQQATSYGSENHFSHEPLREKQQSDGKTESDKSKGYHEEKDDKEGNTPKEKEKNRQKEDLKEKFNEKGDDKKEREDYGRFSAQKDDKEDSKEKGSFTGNRIKGESKEENSRENGKEEEKKPYKDEQKPKKITPDVDFSKESSNTSNKDEKEKKISSNNRANENEKEQKYKGADPEREDKYMKAAPEENHEKFAHDEQSKQATSSQSPSNDRDSHNEDSTAKVNEHQEEEHGHVNHMGGAGLNPDFASYNLVKQPIHHVNEAQSQELMGLKTQQLSADDQQQLHAIQATLMNSDTQYLNQGTESPPKQMPVGDHLDASVRPQHDEEKQEKTEHFAESSNKFEHENDRLGASSDLSKIKGNSVQFSSQDIRNGNMTNKQELSSYHSKNDMKPAYERVDDEERRKSQDDSNKNSLDAPIPSSSKITGSFGHDGENFHPIAGNKDIEKETKVISKTMEQIADKELPPVQYNRNKDTDSDKSDAGYQKQSQLHNSNDKQFKGENSERESNNGHLGHSYNNGESGYQFNNNGQYGYPNSNSQPGKSNDNGPSGYMNGDNGYSGYQNSYNGQTGYRPGNNKQFKNPSEENEKEIMNSKSEKYKEKEQSKSTNENQDDDKKYDSQKHAGYHDEEEEDKKNKNNENQKQKVKYKSDDDDKDDDNEKLLLKGKNKQRQESNQYHDSSNIDKQQNEPHDQNRQSEGGQSNYNGKTGERFSNYGQSSKDDNKDQGSSKEGYEEKSSSREDERKQSSYQSDSHENEREENSYHNGKSSQNENDADKTKGHTMEEKQQYSSENDSRKVRYHDENEHDAKNEKERDRYNERDEKSEQRFNNEHENKNAGYSNPNDYQRNDGMSSQDNTNNESNNNHNHNDNHNQHSEGVQGSERSGPNLKDGNLHEDIREPLYEMPISRNDRNNELSHAGEAQYTKARIDEYNRLKLMSHHQDGKTVDEANEGDIRPSNNNQVSEEEDKKLNHQESVESNRKKMLSFVKSKDELQNEEHKVSDEATKRNSTDVPDASGSYVNDTSEGYPDIEETAKEDEVAQLTENADGHPEVVYKPQDNMVGDSVVKHQITHKDKEEAASGKIISPTDNRATKKDNTENKGLLTMDPFLDAVHYWPFEISHSVLTSDIVTGHNAILMESAEIRKDDDFQEYVSTEKNGSYIIAGDFKGTCFSDPSKCIMGGMTISFWTRLDESKIRSDQDAYIISSGGQSKKSRGFAFLYFHGEYVACLSTQDRQWKMTIKELPLKKWINIVFVWKSKGQLTFYLNGEKKQSVGGNATSRPSVKYTILTISRPNNAVNSDFMFPVRIGCLALWDRPLTSSKIMNSYDNIKRLHLMDPALKRKRSRMYKRSKLTKLKDHAHLLENEK